VAAGSTLGTSRVNIFLLTNSRLASPTDVLFNRLATLRQGQALTALDEQLRERLSSNTMRKLYLRFGPTTIVDCPFCIPSDPSTYLLYHFPRNVVQPHLLNFGILGLATSATIAGVDASTWRFYALAGALFIAAFDAWYTSTYDPVIDANMPSPAGLFWVLAVLRPLTLSGYDALVAFVVYASATNRFLLFSGPTRDSKIVQQQIADQINKSGMAMSTAATKMRATNLARNAVVRNTDLRQSEDHYWRRIAEHEGPQDLRSGVFEDDEVQAALARAYGSGSVQVDKIRKEADAFVRGVTQSLLEKPVPASSQ
jgi:hypothetical protein